ncbi:MAG: VPLPA-CTERM sorting domain-containing protein [Smithella sp.]
MRKQAKRILISICMIVVLFVFSAGAASASFFDNFNTENGGVGLLNYNNFTQWQITNGTVDLIGSPGFWNYFPSYGLYVDLDGSSGQAGIMTTKTTFAPGSYKLEFLLAGSQRGDTNTVDISMGNWTQTLTLNSSDPLTLYSYNITINTVGPLSFHNRGGDDVGAILDNVSVSASSSTVPIPAAAWLLGSGLLGLVGLRKKFNK